MQTHQLSPDVSRALDNAQSDRVHELARELSQFGLAVAMPHHHDDNRVAALPADKIQYENNLKVSFLDKQQFEESRKHAFPVMWRLDPETDRVEPCAWCHDD